jgi:phospholipid/cholesterol/gamma-HCH transport system substrate-binding protein
VRLTRRVGAVTLLVLAASIAFAIFIAPQIEWGPRIRIRVYFHHTGGLREGAPLVVGGRSIGRVESISPLSHGAPGPLGGEPGVVVTVAVAAAAAERVRSDGDVFIASRGALSERYLEIGPSRGEAPALAEGDELLGRDPPTLDRVLERTWNNLTVSYEFVRAVRPEYEQLRREAARLGESIDDLVGDVISSGGGAVLFDLVALRAEARALREVGLGGDAGLARLDAVIAGTRALIARARGELDALGATADRLAASAGTLRARAAGAGLDRFGVAIARARAALAKIDPLLAKVQELNGRIARGEGSLGRLMRDPEFPEDAKELGKIMKRQPWKIIGRPEDDR